jgi:hypothetical protein
MNVGNDGSPWRGIHNPARSFFEEAGGNKGRTSKGLALSGERTPLSNLTDAGVQP